MEIAELENAYYDSIKELKEGDVVRGKIVKVTPKEVIVDVGYKSEGIIARDELEGVDLEKMKEIDVYIENVEDNEGKILISYKKAKETKGWQKLIDNYKEGDLVEGRVSRKVKGGYMIDIFGVEGFLPQSLSMFKGKPDEEILDKKFYFQIIKMNKAKTNFILSRKDAVKKEKELARRKIWEEIETGKIMKGKVKSITNFGAFVDLGGVDGLLHIVDMSWKKISHPSEVVAPGDEIKVMVLSFDREKGKISLGLKQTMPDPWKDIDKKYPAGSIVKGKITNIQNYGIFVELEKGIEGLVHISEVSWTKKFINLNEMFAIGDTVEAKVIGVNSEEKKISLSIKQLENDPWQEIEKLVALDSMVKAKVVGFGEGCAYLELENGLEGIVYTEDLSWTKKINRAQEVLRRNQILDFKVLGIDKINRRLILGRKQVCPNPWPQIKEKFPIGKIVEGEVVKITNFGVFVKIDKDLEGLVFSQEIDKELMEKLKVKDKLKVKIIKVDSESAKIGLSTKIDEENNQTTS
ncbi:MAG TPA: S1 RNA-binding domain-containing protein [Candidatus Omnitrophica bacterium]|nr:S1 RNA-binding domain-containing protein [Candidatus Omnitrophota bacterium]